MGVENFIPTIWHAAIQRALRKMLVYRGTANREFEQDVISFGDRVKVNEIGSIDINDYTKRQDVTWQEVDSAQQTILIDQAKYWAISLDDIDNRQSQPKLIEEFGDKAAYAMSDTIDQHLAGLYTQAGSTVSSVTISAGTVMLNLSNLKLALDDENVPSEGRFLPIPPWYHIHALNATTGSLTATGVPKVFDSGRLVTGFVGNLYGFNLLISNNVNNNATVWNLMAYTTAALAHIQQINKIVAESPISGKFSDGIRGLTLYGSKVNRPAAMVKCAATKG